MGEKSSLGVIAQYIKIRDLRAKLNGNSWRAGHVFGYAFHLFYFIVLPFILKQFWANYAYLFEEKTWFLGMGLFNNNIALWSLNLLMYLIYSQCFPSVQVTKNEQSAWPWIGKPSQWDNLIKRTIKIIFLNSSILTTIVLYLSVQKDLGLQFSLESWPNLPTIWFQFLVCVLAEDFLFYHVHMLLHKPAFYWIHKQHHLHTKTIALAAYHSHPIEFFFSGVVPTAAGLQILKLFMPVHFGFSALWFWYRLMQSYIGHCGYDFDFDPINLFPFALGSAHHDFHHAKNCGNYGSLLMIWDAFWGTQSSYIQYLERRVAQKEKEEGKKQK